MSCLIYVALRQEIEKLIARIHYTRFPIHIWLTVRQELSLKLDCCILRLSSFRAESTEMIGYILQ